MTAGSTSAPRRRVARTCRVEATTHATIDAVWRVLSDVTRTPEWSHECHHVEWLGGATAAAPGVRFRGANRSLWWRWRRTCEVLVVEPPHMIAWRTIPTRLFVDSTDWRVVLEPAGDGTLIVQEFRVTRCPRWWELLVAHLNSPHIDRTQALTDDLRRLGEVSGR